MSSSVDERIVKLGFDNGKFEKGVSQSMSTLDKLEEKLKFKHAEEGTKNIQRAFNGFDFSVMSRGIESLEKRFSTMGIAGMNVVNKITDSIIGAAKRIESATIGQIKAGGWSRAMNLANAQFQIEGLGEDWNEMQKAISYGVKDTAYGLDAAASAASSLVASGVAYKESIDGANDSLMHTSLRAISGVAAMTNSSYEDISRIFTTVAGNGRLMGDQLLQLSSRGLNVAANLANAFGKTEAEIRDMVSHGQIDFETFATAMDDAFGAHAKEANKTFTGALSNMKAALSRFGAVFATPVIEKTNTLFISLTSRIDELKGKLNSVTVPKSMEELHKELDNLNLTAAGFDAVSKSISEKTIDLGKDFADMWQSGIDAFSALIEAVDLSWFDTIVEKVDTATNKVKWFFDTLKDYLKDSSEDTATEVNDAAKSMMVSAEEAAAARDVIAGKYGTGASRANKLKELFGEQSAKNIQTYVNAVAAAGYDYEKSAVKIEEASEEIVLSEEELAKKEKLKGIFDNLKNSGNNFLAAAKNIAIVITSVGKAIFRGFGFNASNAGSMLEKVSSIILKISYKIGTYVLPLLDSITIGVSNLWQSAKNVAGSIKVILSSVFSAFASVFKIDTSSVSNGIVDITKRVKSFSEKLIISEDGANRIQKASEKIFSIISWGLKFVKQIVRVAVNGINAVVNSDGLSLIKDKLTAIFDYVGNLDLDKLSKNPIVEFLKAVITGVDGAVQSNADLPSKLTTFVNAIVEAISNLRWGSIIAISGAIFVVTSIARLVLSINVLGKAVNAISLIPGRISGFFLNASNAMRKVKNNIGKLMMAETVWILAKSLALIAAAIFVLSLVDEQKLFDAAAVIVIVGFVLGLLIKSITRSISSTTSSVLSIIKSLSILTMVLRSVSAMIVGLAVSVLIISAALMLIGKTGAGTASNLLTLFGILSMIVLVVGAIIYMTSSIDVKKTSGLSLKIAAVALMMLSLSVSVLIISSALLVMSKIPAEAAVVVAGLLSIIFIGIIAIVSATKNTSAAKLLTASVSIIAIGVAIGILLLALSSTMLACMASLKMLDGINGDIPALLLSFVGIISAIFLMIYAITTVASSVVSATKTSVVLLSISVMLITIGLAVSTIIAAMRLLSGVDNSSIVLGMVAIVVVLSIIGSLISGAKTLNPAQIMSIAVLFIGVGAAMLLIASAIKKIENTQLSTSAMVSVVSIIATIGLILSLLTAVTASAGSTDGLLTAGTAFIMMAVGMIVLAEAVKILASVQRGLIGAVVVFGAFAVIMVVLAAIATKLPTFGDAMLIIGKAFIYAGVGAALVGAGMILVAAGFKLFANALATLAPTLETVFSAIENHWGTFIIGSVVLVVVLGLIVAGIVELASVIKPIVELIVTGLTTILTALGNFSSKASNGVDKISSTMTVRTKMMIANIIGGLIAAIIASTPETLDAIGQVIIKVLAWLGRIAGDVAEGLVNFLIEVINGVADAIMNNSSRIWAALKSVLYAIADLVLQILGGIIADIADWFGAGNKVREFINGTSEELMRKSLETRKAAEASAEAKKEVYNNIRGVADDTEEASKSTSDANDRATLSFLGIGKGSESSADEVEKAMGRITNATGQSSEQVAENLEKAREAIGRLKAAAFYDKLDAAGQAAAARSLQSGWNAKKYENAGKTNGQSYGEGLADGTDNTLSKLIPENMTNTLGLGSDTNSLTENLGVDTGTTFASGVNDGATAELINPDAYANSMDVNMSDGIVSSIADHKSDVENATRTSVTEAMTKIIHDSRDDLESASKYALRGWLDGVDKEKPVLISSMADLVKALKYEVTGPDGYKIESPSKVAYDWGRYIVMGLSNGVRNSTTLATDSAAELSDAMIISFGAPLDYLAKIASGELIYDPSIRPVIDSSAIRSGAGTINSMIGAQQIQLSGYSGQLAADISQLDNSNLMVVNELRQLREDMAVMTEEITNMQMVMDTGALVGQISGPIDRSLGRNAVRKGRGN